MKGTQILIDKKAGKLEDYLINLISGARKIGYQSIIMPLVLRFKKYNWSFEVKRNNKSYGYLRPEGTEQYLSYLPEIEKGKHYYWGPMFRSERSQSLRRREFYQFCMETFSKKFYFEEVESIKFCHKFLSENFNKFNFKLKVNHLGNEVDKGNFLNFVSKKIGINIGQGLHGLDKGTIKISSLPFLSSEAKLDFKRILNGLDERKIKWEWDPFLFRGLSYYNGFIFEISISDKTVVGGGRYDGAWGKYKRNKSTWKHFGWGMGITRLLELTGDDKLQKQS